MEFIFFSPGAKYGFKKLSDALENLNFGSFYTLAQTDLKMTKP